MTDWTPVVPVVVAQSATLGVDSRTYSKVSGGSGLALKPEDEPLHPPRIRVQHPGDCAGCVSRLRRGRRRVPGGTRRQPRRRADHFARGDRRRLERWSDARRQPVHRLGGSATGHVFVHAGLDGRDQSRGRRGVQSVERLEPDGGVSHAHEDGSDLCGDDSAPRRHLPLCFPRYGRQRSGHSATGDVPALRRGPRRDRRRRVPHAVADVQ